MRSKFTTAAVALAAVFVLGAVASSSALATPAWYVKEGGTFHKLTSALEVHANTNLVLTDEPYKEKELNIYVSESCLGSMKFKLEPGGVSKIETYGAAGCKFSKKNAPASCGGIVTDLARHVPWKSELYLEGTEIRERLVSGGSGTPEWEFECGNNQFEDSCGFNTSAHAINNALNSVEAQFEAKSNKTFCSWGAGEFGNKESGSLTGTIKLELPKGVEAIKVE